MVTFHGYAVPFNQFGIIRPGFYERIEHGAFTAMVARKISVPVLLCSHTGPAIGHTALLFQDAYGLGFSFDLDMRAKENGGHLYAITHSFCFASINFADRKGEWETVGDEQHRCITAATIDHIAICDETAVYRGSGVWRADSYFLPGRLAALKRQWLDAF